MRSDRERLLDILEAIDEIDRYAVRGRSAFDADELIQGWTVRPRPTVLAHGARSDPRVFGAKTVAMGGSDD